jgi:S1-C subfamily serine protease
MTRTRTFLVFGAGVLACAFSAGAATANAAAPSAHTLLRPDDGPEYKKLIDGTGPAVVTVKFVLKIEGNDMGRGENETEISGIVIDPTGVILCSNVQTGGLVAMMGGGAANPTDMKVLIGDDTEGKKARLLTRDSELDLAWVKLDEPPTSPLKFVDLSKGVAPTVGQRLLSLGRMGKYFDRVPVVGDGRIIGETNKPRHLFIPDNSLASGRGDLGAPVFTTDGTVVGIIIVQFPEEGAEGGGAGPRDAGAMVLPAAEVAKATKRAMENPVPPDGAKKDDKGGPDSKDAAKKPADKKNGEKSEPPKKDGGQ